MNDVKSIMICVGAKFRQQLTSFRLYTILAIIVVFHYYSFASTTTVCEYLNLKVTPWVFPFFLGNPNYFFIFGGLAMLLYCDAPFLQSDAPFLLIRLGRMKWIICQMVYIFCSAFIYTLFHVLMSILMLLPYVAFSTQWGDVLMIISQRISIFQEAGVSAGFYPVNEIMNKLTPFEAMGISILLFYLGTVFIGMVITCFRVRFGGMYGIVFSGLLTSVAYFTPYLGSINFGKKIYYFSPIVWSCISSLDWQKSGDVPNIQFAVITYLSSIFVMFFIAIIAFCKKDVYWEEV